MKYLIAIGLVIALSFSSWLFIKNKRQDLDPKDLHTFCAKVENEIDSIIVSFKDIKTGPEAVSLFYGHFNKYGQTCDDGGLAEYYSGFAVQCLGVSPEAFNTTSQYMIENNQFNSFILRHLNMTASSEEIDRVEKLAKSNCGPTQQKICDQILARIKELNEEAQREMKKNHP